MPYYPLPGGASYVSVFSFIHLYLSINCCPTVHPKGVISTNFASPTGTKSHRCIVLNTEITNKWCFQNSIPIVRESESIIPIPMIYLGESW